jgi:hypothetical protein
VAVRLALLLLLTGAAALTTAGSALADGWTAQPAPVPLIANGSLSGVSCAGSDCVAVGSAVDASGKTDTLAESSDGSGWTVQTSPNPAGAATSELSGVSCPTAAACVAVGSYTTPGGEQIALIERWDGAAWSMTTAPTPAGALVSSLAGVSCTAADACTAVGSYTDQAGDELALAERWDGISWALESVPSPAGESGVSLNGVSCTGPSNCVAVGVAEDSSQLATLTVVESWDGSGWKVENSPNQDSNDKDLPQNELEAVSCVSDSTCVAVGYAYAAGASTFTPLAMSWDGSTWTLGNPVDPEGAWYASLAGMSCTSATSCNAVGSWTNGEGDQEPALEEHWDGSTWTVQSETGSVHGLPYEPLAAISCRSDDACAAVGQASGDYSPQPGVAFSYGVNAAVAAQWDGTTWTVGAAAGKRGASSSTFQAVSCGSATDCFAVGSHSTTDDELTLIEHWDGSAWSIVSSPNPSGSVASQLESISCPDAADCMAVGHYVDSSGSESMLAERWDGSSWTLVSPTGSGSQLSSVSCPSADSCMAVGGQAAELWDGSGWTDETFASYQYGWGLTGVSCSAPSSCMAVGQEIWGGYAGTGIAEQWNGSTWSTTPNTTWVDALSCLAGGDCLAVGSLSRDGADTSATAAWWDGSTWSVVRPVQIEAPPTSGGTINALYGVSCQTSTDCTAVGEGNGQALTESYNGTGWSRESGPDLNVNLYGISCPVGGQCETVGATGYPGNGEQLYAAQYDGGTVGPPDVPSDQTLPTIGGDTGAGDTLTESNGTWTNDPTSYDYQWEDCDASGGNCSPIADATAETYVIAPSDLGHTIRVEETAINADGPSTEASSDPTAVIGDPPAISSEQAFGPASSSAKLGASVEPNGIAVSDCELQWGTDTTYEQGLPVPCDQRVGAGTTTVPVTAEIVNLTPDTTYHYRFVAQNDVGRTYGADATFTTPPAAPTVTTGAAEMTGAGSASIAGTVNPNGAAVTDCKLEWGTDATYDQGLPVPCSPAPGSGTDAVSVSATVTGLTPSTTYHYRFVAQNSAGRTYGADQTFLTPSAAHVTKPVATVLSTTAPRAVCPASAKTCRLPSSKRTIDFPARAKRVTVRVYLYSVAGVRIQGATLVVAQGRHTSRAKTAAGGSLLLKLTAKSGQKIAIRFAGNRLYSPATLTITVRRSVVKR